MNVLGKNLKLCGSNTLTEKDMIKLVCAIVTKEFLDKKWISGIKIR
jgi:uncharacterized protein (DUF2237 family)